MTKLCAHGQQRSSCWECFRIERDQLRADLDAARKEVERLSILLRDARAAYNGMSLAYDREVEDNARLREALRKHGVHGGNCRWPDSAARHALTGRGKPVCTCGLDSALAGHGGG